LKLSRNLEEEEGLETGNAQGRAIRSQWVLGSVNLNTGDFFNGNLSSPDVTPLC